MIIHWKIRVKFRMFGITYGTVEREGAFPIPVHPAAAPVPFEKILMNDKGVYAMIEMVPAIGSE